MGSFQSNTATAIEDLQNNILQVTEENCHAKCSNYDGGGTVVIDGTTIKGDLDIVQQCTATASCTMNQTLQSQVQNIMSAIAAQSQKSEQSFINFTLAAQANSSEIKENITNTITQVMESACQATSSNIQQDDIVILRNDTVGGNFFLGQKGSANANCVLNNVAKQVLFNQQQAKQDQTQKVENVFAIIAIAIVIILVLAAIFVFIIIGPKGIKEVTKEVEGASGGTSSSSGKSKSSSGNKSSGLLGLLKDDPELLLA